MNKEALIGLSNGLLAVGQIIAAELSPEQFEAFRITSDVVGNLIYREDKKNDNR